MVDANQTSAKSGIRITICMPSCEMWQPNCTANMCWRAPRSFSLLDGRLRHSANYRNYIIPANHLPLMPGARGDFVTSAFASNCARATTRRQCIWFGTGAAVKCLTERQQTSPGTWRITCSTKLIITIIYIIYIHPFFRKYIIACVFECASFVVGANRICSYLLTKEWDAKRNGLCMFIAEVLWSVLQGRRRPALHNHQ